MSSIERAKRVLKIEAEAVNRLVERLDDRFVDAVDILLSCTGRVVVTGIGKSGIIGKKIASTLASTGTPALFLHPAEGVHGDLGMVTRGDAVIAISNSGETEELAKILPLFKRLEVKLIAMTGGMNSTLARHSDVVLDVSVKEEACPLGLAPTASTTATLAMGDALAVALLEERGFRAEDFAFNHPSGSLGRRLLRVADLMHGGESLPVVKTTQPVREILFEITSKRLGMTTVVDAEGKLAGIVTDGDLRRALERSPDIMNKTSDEIMAKSPRRISGDALAAEAVAIMEDFSITSLIIVSPDGRPEGVVHLHDLLKAGVV
ncbi:MAG: KpsF/GutQ family sugar-phosphate isomerase [Nitrospirota bacterium]|nr:KpsF/GutQ family sugar-phosphate isomerase [Nitrospirota bacterium]